MKFTLPADLIKAFDGKKETSLEISSGVGSVTFDAKAMNEINKAAEGKDAILSIGKVNDAKLSGDSQEMVGDRPVFAVNVFMEDKPASGLNGGKADMFIPYALAKGENADSLTVYAVDEKSNLHEIKDVKYDSEKKGFAFTTETLGTFAIGHISIEEVPTRLGPVLVPAAFDDVPETYWVKEYIDYLSARGLIHGIGDNLFAPENDISRAEFATLLFNMSGDELPSGKTKFNDVLVTAWYAPYVTWAFENGITSGTFETTFSPDDKITRQDMAVMLKRYMDMKGIEMDKVNQPKTFVNVNDIADYARDLISEMQQMGIITGMENGAFEPEGKATRAQAATMIAKILMSFDKQPFTK